MLIAGSTSKILKYPSSFGYPLKVMVLSLSVSSSNEDKHNKEEAIGMKSVRFWNQYLDQFIPNLSSDLWLTATGEEK